MLPLAKFWTWLGNYFVPLAVAWGYFVRNGPDQGVQISRAYWGLAVSLLVGVLLISTLSLYIKKARSAKAIAIPPNTTFESESDRNLVLSWGSAVTYILTLITALIVFGKRYSDSKIHAWEKNTSLVDSFWGSRAVTFTRSCNESSCYAMGNRFGADGKPLEYVDQYLPYVTDPALALLGLLLFVSIVVLLVTIFRKPPASLEQNDY
ncbi:hypothetical protein [Bradyrhizobium icense]|uniref:Uncharacterized protein n=1 Tax=Bradyrhizobium icense TaxID=1274631 RepID=A0A1B1UIY5_9BRAD|nr:hypothetical protein [Bradyrhizobium icense]ANW02710.1 hypothetical protein LMTR13_23645 [Bradyrhizobium icense]